MRGSIRELTLNCAENAVDIAEYIIVPEATDFVAFIGQPTIADCILGGFAVLSAINLNDEQLLAANKIANVALDRQLTHELVSIDLPIAKSVPEDGLGIRSIDA